MPGLSFQTRRDSVSVPFPHSQHLSEETKKEEVNLWALIIHHLSLHRCHGGGELQDSENKVQAMLKLQEQKGLLEVICHAFLLGRQNRKALRFGSDASEVSDAFALECLFCSRKYSRCSQATTITQPTSQIRNTTHTHTQLKKNKEQKGKRKVEECFLHPFKCEKPK